MQGVDMKKDKFDKCKTCKHHDKEKSNQNFNVCKALALDPVIDGTADNCSKFEAL
jgi:hypothetical protein